MTDQKSRYYKDISVKAYAKLINKSDKTVYKMIKDGLIGASKKSKGYVIRVDSFMLNRCEDINKNLHSMKELMASFESRLKELEEKKKNKPLVKKVLKTAKKPIVKTLKKAQKKTTKTMNKSGKKNVTKK
jgi:hypothetical protein